MNSRGVTGESRVSSETTFFMTSPVFNVFSSRKPGPPTGAEAPEGGPVLGRQRAEPIRAQQQAFAAFEPQPVVALFVGEKVSKSPPPATVSRSASVSGSTSTRLMSASSSFFLVLSLSAILLLLSEDPWMRLSGVGPQGQAVDLDLEGPRSGQKIEGKLARSRQRLFEK